jgi:hypothetical protein
MKYRGNLPCLDTPLIRLPTGSRFLCRSRPSHPELLKGTLNALVVEGQTLEDLRCLTGPTSPQCGLYAQRDQADRASDGRPACELLLPLPGWSFPSPLREGVATECFSSSCFSSSCGFLPLVRRPSTADVVALASDETRVV